MSTNGLNTTEEADMTECDGEKVVTMMDVLQEQEEFEEDANAVLGASDDKNCTYSKGYIKRQAIYACLTCCGEAREDPSKRAGVCLACSLACHENHELVELYTKRNFRCDCGNPKFNSHPCQFTPDKTDLNGNNNYNQNFSGLYCICHRPYPDPENTVDDEMIQCIICEDWLHFSHLDATVPTNDYAEMICKECLQKNEFIHDYSDFAVNNVIDIITINGTESDGNLEQTLADGDKISSEKHNKNEAKEEMDVDISVQGKDSMNEENTDESSILNSESCVNEGDSNKVTEGSNAPNENGMDTDKSEEKITKADIAKPDNEMETEAAKDSSENLISALENKEESSIEEKNGTTEFANDIQKTTDSEDNSEEKGSHNSETVKQPESDTGKDNSDNDKEEANLNSVENKDDQQITECNTNDNQMETSESKSVESDNAKTDSGEKHTKDTENGKVIENNQPTGIVDDDEMKDNNDEKSSITTGKETATSESGVDIAKEHSAPIESGEQSVPMESGEQSVPIESGEQSVPIESGEQSVLIESGEQSVPIESGEQSVPIESGEQSVPIESGEQSVPIESGEQSVLIESGEQLVLIESEEQSVLIESGEQSVPIESGEQSIPTESKEQSIPTESKEQSVPKESGIESKSIEEEIGTESKDSVTSVPRDNVDDKQSFESENTEILPTEQSAPEENKVSQIALDQSSSVNEIGSGESEISNVHENKRKISTEESETDIVAKKAKFDDSQCMRPKGIKKRFKGASFWPSNFRQKLCTCNECLSVYKDLSVLFLIDPEDTVTAYETLGKEKINGAPASQYEKGLLALSSLDRVQQINALTEYNKLRDKLLVFLRSFSDRKEVVKEEDIKAFFAGMKPKRRPDGVYFCR